MIAGRTVIPGMIVSLILLGAAFIFGRFFLMKVKLIIPYKALRAKSVEITKMFL